MQGSFDPKGFRMVAGRDGKPVFLPAKASGQADDGPVPLGAGDENWDSQFCNFYTDGDVFAAAASDTDFYVGGNFTYAGGYAVNNVARWDGTNWASMNNGLNGIVYALTVSGSDVYVGGAFIMAGSVTVNRIAKWNKGTNVWSPLGSGVNNNVFAIAVSGTDVYIGGSFTQAGGSPASRIAKWDGSAWSALGNGMNAEVRSLAVSGTDVYAGGLFTQAGSVSAAHIARWDGANWAALGAGVDGTVFAIAMSGTSIIAGGTFNNAGESPAASTALWNGSGWSALGSGTDGYVTSLLVDGTDVYAAGEFTEAGGGAASNIAKWNGSGWSLLESGLSADASAMAMKGTELLVVGAFGAAGDHQANRVAIWDKAANKWPALSSGSGGSIHAITVAGTDIYVGGSFTDIGGIPASRIAKWDGAKWSTLGTGMDDVVKAIAVIGTDVYAGGYFYQAGGNYIVGIAKWNGAAWSKLGSGLSEDGRVLALAVIGDDLYAGGYFSDAGGTGAQSIAKWDGDSWSALGNGIDFQVYALAASGTDLYVAGYFWTAGTTPANSVAKWNGSSWSALGSGLDGYALACAASGTDLYVGGQFTTAGGVSATNVARWDGDSWSAVGDGPNGVVTSLYTAGSTLYMGGNFDDQGDVPANYIAKWNGQNWSGLGDGTDALVYGIRVLGGDVYLGGEFMTAGGIPSHYFGRYLAPMTVTTPNGGEEWEAGSAQTITWTGTAANVKIEYSTNNGATWTTLVESMANTGSLYGMVPYTPSSQCLVRVTDADDAGRSDTSDAAFTISGFILTSPNGGELWMEKSSQTITWTRYGSIPAVRLLYSTNGGGTWTEITASAVNNGSYPWSVPSTFSTQCLVRIRDAADNNPYDTSDAVFSIVPMPVITVTAPNGGESWLPGSTHNITWTSTAMTGAVTIDLYKGGVYRKTLGTANIEAGVFSWGIDFGETPGTDYLILIWQLSVSDISDGVFSIPVLPTIALTSPNGGESWALGSTHAVTWTQTNVTGAVTIDLYKGGVWQKTLGAPDASAGTFSWAIAPTELVGTDYTIRIWQEGGVSDDSDANFTLRTMKVDFNKDGQEDILWRYQGTGELQGQNVVWLMNQTGGLGSMALGQAQVEAGLASRTPLEIGDRRVQEPTKAQRSPMREQDVPVLRQRVGRWSPLGSEIPPVRDSALPGMMAGAPGEVRLAAAGVSGYLYPDTIADLDWEIATAGDFNGDGNTDILWRNYGSGTYSGWNCIWYMNGRDIIGYGYPERVLDLDWRIVGAGDFNGDGNLDILWRNYGIGEYGGWNCLWYMDGEVITGYGQGAVGILEYGYPERVLDLDWKIAATGDFDGDGNLDMLWRNYGTGTYSGWNCIWYMNGEVITGYGQGAVGILAYGYPERVLDLGWEIVGAGDFNGDGNLDILWRNYGTGTYSGWNCLWYMNGEVITGYGQGAVGILDYDYPTIMPDLKWRIVNR